MPRNSRQRTPRQQRYASRVRMVGVMAPSQGFRPVHRGPRPPMVVGLVPFRRWCMLTKPKGPQTWSDVAAVDLFSRSFALDRYGTLFIHEIRVYTDPSPARCESVSLRPHNCQAQRQSATDPYVYGEAAALGTRAVASVTIPAGSPYGGTWEKGGEAFMSFSTSAASVDIYVDASFW